jgi:mono/diheme cytochrome c family protein
LRIIEVLPKATPIADAPRLGLCGQDTGKFVVGTVPVEADGSAYFEAPSGVPLLFQALDENGLAVAGMRSVTYLQRGQTLACVGCHEPRNTAPPSRVGLTLRGSPLAAHRPPSVITPGPDGSGPLSFPLLVQPVLDHQCVSCHGEKDPSKGFVLTGTRSGQFSRAYETLMARQDLVHRYVAYNGEGTTLPYRFGAHASGLIKLLRAGHQGVQLTRDDWDRLATWIDANSLYYGTFDPALQAKQQQGERIPSPGLQ